MKTKRKTTTAPRKRREGFTDEEKSAMRSRVKEMSSGDHDGESEVLAKIAEMTPADRTMAEKIHALVKSSAPSLTARTWYGMPAYAREGKIVCHFQPAQKFKTRYPTLGFSDAAKLDDGNVWPVAYAIDRLTAADEAAIKALIRKAAG
jgi:uncharacterized protein YdhG (YjbR/CyaY superfamily)